MAIWAMKYGADGGVSELSAMDGCQLWKMYCQALRWVPNCRGSESKTKFIVLMEPPTTCLTYKTKKSDGDREVLDTGERGDVPAKGTPMAKLASLEEKKEIHAYSSGCEDIKGNKVSVTMIGR